MLEIPESNTIADQLTKTVKGKIVKTVYPPLSPHGFAWYFGDPAEYHDMLAGKMVGSAVAHAGQVEIGIEDARLLFADGVNIRYLEAGKKRPEKYQLCVEFADGSALVCTVQMYGGLWAFFEGENDNPYYLVAKEKPSPLSADFDERYFDELISACKPSLSVKALLATEQRIPGLGNGVLQDILFRAGLHPKKKTASLTDGQKPLLFESVKHTLADMAEQGGRDTEKDLFGESGGYHTILSSKTLAYPCPVCGGPLTRQAYMGGNVYFCSTCQTL